MPNSPISAAIIGRSPVVLWGLSADERLRRQLRVAGVTHFLNGNPSDYPVGSVVMFRADHLFDDRTIRDLIGAPNVLLHVPTDNGAGSIVAANVSHEQVVLAHHRVEGMTTEDPPGMEVRTPSTLSSAYVQQLKKTAPPVVLALHPDRRAVLERYLFDGAYKGVTDLVTKWIWPAPARVVTRWCAERGVRPNTVTLVSYGLAVLAALLFASGWFGLGLLLAWIMTFLDTVDGKLARVTVASTSFGNVLDHALDLVHPPFWYLAWGSGLPSFSAPLGFTLETVFVVIFTFYIVERLTEGVFDYLLAKFTIFSWRPVDSYFRLIMARRNPCLLLLSIGYLWSRPADGLTAVAIWTAASAMFLLARLVVAVRWRIAGQTFRPWLADVGVDGKDAWLARPFAQRPAPRDRAA